MSDNVTNIAEARAQRQRRQLQQQATLVGQHAAAAFLAHLEAVARGAPQEVVNKRWRAVEERAAAYQELLGTDGVTMPGDLDTEALAQIDGEFESDWLETLRATCLQGVRSATEARPGEANGEERLRHVCQLAYRRGYATGMINAARSLARGEDE